VLERHDPPSPDACDVCKYAVERGVDCEAEHALTRLATMLLIYDLQDASGPTRLSGLAVGTFGVEPGPVHRVEPRHWYWALMHEPDIQLVLREGANR
jgi:hypothetical protein